MSFHETIEAQQKANLLNQEFENKTGEGYQNALETKMGLYGDYKSEKTEIRDPFAKIDGSEGDSENPELMDDVEEIKENIISKQIQKSPYYPILKSLKITKNISEEDFNHAVQKLDKTEKNNQKTVLFEAIKQIPDSKTKKEIINEVFNKKEVTQESFEKTDFFKDSKEINIKLDAGVGGLEILLAENYIKIPQITSNGIAENKHSNLETSLDIVLNKIITNNSKTFEEQNADLISEIKSEKNLNSKYEKLKKLYKADLKRDAEFGGKKALKEISGKKKSLQEKAKINTQKLEEFKNLELTDTQEQEKQKLLLEKKEIIVEAKETDLFNGEIFEAGLLDINSEATEQKEYI